ncbi:MAG TPA: winged helix-turn-helix domain-containing protein [Micromonosporaceae bacterium]
MVYDPDDQLDQYAPDPLYKQLAGILAARVERGDWEPGAVFPSESRLRQEYGVARGTVRQAIKVLVDAGLVVVAPQRGTYVKPTD